MQKIRRKCKMGVIGYTPLFYNITMSIGLRYRCIMHSLPFWLVFWWLCRLRHYGLVDEQCITAFKYNYFELLVYLFQLELVCRNEVVVNCCLTKQGLYICCRIVYVSGHAYLIYHEMGCCIFTTQIRYNVDKQQFYYIWRLLRGVSPKRDKSVQECERVRQSAK